MKEWSKLLGLISNEDKDDQRVENIQEIPLEKIEANPYQPRKEFDEDKLQELIQSIKTYGLLQPIVVRKVPDSDKYQIVAGERRYRALTQLQRETVSAIVRNLNDTSMAALAMIENIQRENLNFVEEAEGYQKLIDEFGLTQEVLAQRLGRSQSTIANKLRLLKLSDQVKSKVNQLDITERHARTLLKLPSEDLQLELLGQVENEKLNVKQTEERAKVLLQTEEEENKDKKTKGKKKRPVIRDLRIFLNTIRQAVSVIKDSGLEPDVVEDDYEDRIEIKITLPKNSTNK
ncbi:nucleoid occlusion protein [Natranaerobius trueperi]|uniref:Nucleoid occlusion protein n=1 Tax=Natranaerobius trueperi TaxID=759412 RepID=A0A226BZC2_9FIRM|nr:nucleoid occlusion protein [Natranaerobius trueperi]OWZ83480.1 nucleoid occlusion protein [Natranaerobius trueperi]